MKKKKFKMGLSEKLLIFEPITAELIYLVGKTVVIGLIEMSNFTEDPFAIWTSYLKSPSFSCP